MSVNNMCKVFEAMRDEKQKELEFNEKEREHLDTIILPKPEFAPKGWADRVMQWVIWGDSYKEWHK